jgi:hypothetical protein
VLSLEYAHAQRANQAIALKLVLVAVKPPALAVRGALAFAEPAGIQATTNQRPAI